MSADENKAILPASVYEVEAKYMADAQRHSWDFDELVGSIPKEQEKVREALRNLYHVEPGKLLDPAKLRKLREENEPLFKEVNVHYQKFLKEKAGLK